MSDGREEGFFARWSKRKSAVRDGRVLPAEPPVVAPVPAPPPALETPSAASVPAASEAPARAETEPPPPTLDDVARLTRESDFRRFVAADVDPAVKNAALKKLFADPQFNVMDGLDTYIDDYGKPDPLPASMLRKMVQSAALGLFEDEDNKPPETAPAPTAHPTRDDPNPAVRLQPDDAAGPSGAADGAGQDAGRER